MLGGHRLPIFSQKGKLAHNAVTGLEKYSHGSSQPGYAADRRHLGSKSTASYTSRRLGFAAHYVYNVMVALEMIVILFRLG